MDAVQRGPVVTRFLYALVHLALCLPPPASADGLESSDPNLGGAGYDGKPRPDLSNTQFLIDALIASGLRKDDPAIQRALKFVNRCQNLPGETNDQPFAKKTSKDDEGGFTYT